MKEKNRDRERLYRKIKDVVRKYNAYKAIQYLHGFKNPLTIAKRYPELAQDFCYSKK